MSLPLATLLAALAIAAGPQNAAIDHFEKKIRPVLASHCYACHSTSAAAPQGGLLLDSTQGIRRGGNSGAAIQPGDPERQPFDSCDPTHGQEAEDAARRSAFAGGGGRLRALDS